MLKDDKAFCIPIKRAIFQYNLYLQSPICQYIIKKIPLAYFYNKKLCRREGASKRNAQYKRPGPVVIICVLCSALLCNIPLICLFYL
jgi:hypothetical protein